MMGFVSTVAPFVLEDEEPEPFNKLSLLNDGDVEGVTGRFGIVC